MANPNRKKRTKEEWDKLTEQAAKNAAKRMQEKKQEQEKEKAKKLTEGRARYNAAGEKNPSKKITAAQAKEAAQDPTSAGAKAIREKVLADMKAQKQAARRKEYAAQQAAARAKEAFSLPLPSATAAKKQETKTGQSPGGALGDRLAEGTRAEKDKDTTGKNPTRAGTQKQAAADFNAPLAQMGRNSTSWSMLREGKDAAKKAKWPEAAVGKMTVKQNALHQKNVEIAKPYDITFDAQKGVWRGGDSYGEWKGAQVYDAKKALPLPGSTASDMVAGARKVRETAGQFQPNPAVPAAQAAENRAKGAQRAKDTLMWPVHQTMAAIGGVSGSLYDTANMALETTGIDKFLPDAVKNWVTKNAQLGHGVQEQVRAVNYERGGKLGGAVGDLAQLGVEMLGQYALAAATGGASAGAQLGAKTGMVSKALETIAKSPNFWYSFVRTAGPEYEEAKANGASGPQAASAAILSALGQAGVEMGGGVETLAGKAAGGVKGAVKSMLEEGGEEAVQDLISGLAHKGVYDKGRGWFGSGDSGAVVNPQRMAGEFAMGALGASLPVGVNALMRRGKTYSLPLPQDSALMAGQTQTAKGLPLPDVRQEATSIDTNPETHTPEQMRTIEEYISSTDADFKSFVQDVTDGKQAAPYALKNVSDRAAQDIKAITGVDAAGFQTKIEPRMIEHIIARHGQNGAADSSMTNIDDIARMQYVIDNYDTMQDGGRVQSYKEPKPGKPSQNRPARSVIYLKKVNGSYYVVQAVPDTRRKTSYIVSAYIQKNAESKTPATSQDALGGASAMSMVPHKEELSIHDALQNAPGSTSVNDSTALPNQSMPQAGAEVKGQEIPDPGILRQTPWQEGETKPRLGGERETRPETARRLTQEEEYEIGKQLDDYLEQQEALRDKLESDLAAARRVLPTPGSEARIQALQSGLEDVNRELAALDGQAARRRAENAEQAQNQLDALESDSYQIPDIIRQEEAAVRRAENAEQAQGQLDALTSDSYRGPEAEGQERMTLAEQMAEQARARGERIAANHPVRRATVRAEASLMDAHAPDAEAAIQTVNGLEGMRQALKRLERQFKLSKADLVTAKELSQGRRPTREVDADRLEKAETYAKLLREYESAMQPFYDYRTQLETARQEAADALLQDADNWKDVKLGASLSANTAERVFEIVAGKDGARLNDSLARPVHEHDAQRNRWENGYRNRLRGIIKGTTREESHYTAMKNYAEYLERAGMDSSKLRTAMNDYLQKNRKKINMGRVETLENALIALTQEMHPEVNETRIRNGYTPLEFTSRYLPALHRADEGGAAARVLRKMFGIETRADALPTEIAGTTANRRPGQPWQSFAMERTGDAGKFNPKDFDAVRAVDEYITGAGREIFFTDDIQNWRTFEERLRYRFSDEGTRAELDSIRTDPNLDAEQKLAEKTKLWERDQYSLPHFPTWLRKYADTLAGKKQLIDRAAEDELSRGFYRTVNDVEGKIAVNLTGFNISTALSNLVALQQGGAELSAPAMARAALDYAGELAGDTAFCERSVFLTNRKGTERIYKTGLQKVQDIGGKPAQWVDDFTSGILTRARYYDNIRRGMTDAQAMQDADGWAARVMGDRSTGARPLLFESKNPLVKVATMFQLEPANNFAHWFHDLPLEKGAAGAAAVLAKLFLTAYLFNDGVEKMTGNRPAPDAIGMVNDLVGRVAGWQLPNTFDLIAEAARGELDEEDFKTEKASPADAALETMQDIGSQIPYVSGPIGAAFGAGSTRFPIESAVPDITKMIQAGLGEGTTESKRAAIAKELAKPFLTIGMPTGGSQLSKTVRGVKTMLEGGAYGYDNDGNKTLKFPAYSGETTDAGKAARFAQAAIFGPYALKSAREYVDSGYRGLNAKGTKAYQTLTGKYGVDQKTAADGIRAVTGAKAPEDGSLTGAQAKREAIMGLDLTPEEKVELNRALVGGDDLVSFQDRDSFNITNTVSASNQPAAFALMREQGMDAAQAKKYAELVDDQGATYTLGKDQKITKTYEDGRQEERLLYTKDGKAARLKKAYETIRADESLTDGQKNGVVRAVVLSKLGKKYAGEYAEEFIGGIGVEQLIDAQAAYDKIYDAVQKDTTIHENNRDEYVRVRFADYLENTGLDFLRRESLWYFQSHGESEFKEPWSEIIRQTTPSDEEERTRKQSALRGLQDSGMDESLFKVIKAGMGRVYADKDANGETIDGSRKRKLIEYLNQYDGLTDEQKNLLMKTDAYKYGMGEKPKKGKSSSRKYPLALPTSFKLPSMKSLLPF